MDEGKTVGACCCIIILALLIYFICGYESFNNDDITKIKHPYQGVSQENIEQQRKDYEKTLEIPRQLVKEYKQMFPDDLLPVDEPSKSWDRVNPKGTGSLELKNMLSAAQHIGVNTVGSSLKNANRQLRSEPPNPMVPVSVWNNSSVTPDIYRKELEIGERSTAKKLSLRP